jgi:endonuclease/exonuclease/phosphatase family metal-dependent hydrolase
MLEQLCARLGRESSAVRDRVTLVHGDIRCDDAGCRFPLIIALEGFETADFRELSGRHRSAAARESGSFERSCHKQAAQEPKPVEIRVSSGIRQRLRRTAGRPEGHNCIVRKQRTDGRRSQVSAGDPKEEQMSFSFKSAKRWRWAWVAALVVAWGLSWPQPALAEPHLVTVMTRNMDAATDLNYILAATDLPSFAAGMAATLAQINASGFEERAARLADEIAAHKPDLIALQEVTLWRTGTILQPPATTVLYDQLDLLMRELAKRKLHYGVVAVQSLFDAEAPVPTEGIDLRITDRDVIVARTDLPRLEFDVFNARSRRYEERFTFGSPILGEIIVPRAWISVDVEILKSRFRFVNTHLESVYPSLPGSDRIQAAQVDDLLTAMAKVETAVVLAGDFNANAEPGPEHTGAVEKIESMGFTDAWKSANPGDPGYTWPLFGEDQASGPKTPNERIDLIFIGGPVPPKPGQTLKVLSAQRTGTKEPWASDHAGVVVELRLK